VLSPAKKDDAMSADIIRKIVDLGDRLVHVRFCGEGPPALILHQSPRTSEEMEPLIKAWSEHFTCIAPDHPGFGLSDPLPMDAPSIEDFADGLAALLDHLGIKALPIYGHHTGAIIAMALGVKYPERASALVLNGVLVNTQADRDDLAQNYLPPFTPSHDASHLMTLWWRMREQSLFFPWYNRKAEARMVYGVRPAAEIQPACMDFLAAGDNYRRGYGAALMTVTQDYVDQLTVPTMVTAVRADPLWVDVGKLETKPPFEAKRFDDMAPLLAASLDHMKSGTFSETFDVARVSQTGSRQVLSQAVTHVYGGDQKPAVLALPDLGMEALAQDGVLKAANTPIFAVNPPGHGLSEPSADWPDAGDIQTLLSFGLGAAHLPHLMQRYPKARVIAVDLLCPTERLDDYLSAYVPDLSPQNSGAHLAAAFLAVRSGKVFWPWFETEHADAIPGEHLLDVEQLHIETRALLRGWQAGRALIPHVPEALEALSAGERDVTIALPDWAEGRSGVRKDFGAAHIMYYDFEKRDTALAALL